ncbi:MULTISPECIES: hypothetical protein [Pelotomaculum]|nr:MULTISPECIES: hypothetical protein [Pelotomaculum]
MPFLEEIRHDLLLTVVVALVILFATGLAGPSRIPGAPIIIP